MDENTISSSVEFILMQWSQTDPVKVHSNQARIHLTRLTQLTCLYTVDLLDQVCSCLVGMKTCSHSRPLQDQFETTVLTCVCSSAALQADDSPVGREDSQSTADISAG